jgi:hypothetical protein
MTDLALYDVDGAPLAHLHTGGVAFAGRALPATIRPAALQRLHPESRVAPYASA